MKIVKRLRDIYDECKPLYTILSEEVREILKPKAEERDWFFLSRLKELESFALKVETGRVPDPAKLEDLFACTIVVPTMAETTEAEKIVLELFKPSKRRPENDNITHKASSSFAFDDLRLYVARRQSTSGLRPELDGLVFEIQIKTVLQHAWSVATHDLIYKTNTISWPTERIAFQVKAMLEHAEIVIGEANKLADAPAIAKRDHRTDAILQLIEQLKQVWSIEHLPADVKRLAVTIFDVFRIADLAPAKFRTIIDAEVQRLGILPADLSPYAFSLQALAHFAGADFEHKFNRRHIRTSILLHDGMDLPAWMNKPHTRIINL